jgi:hypothetical protein
MRRLYRKLFDDGPEPAARVANRIVVGNFVADREDIEGFNMPGSPTSIQAIAIYQVAAGKISRLASYF